MRDLLDRVFRAALRETDPAVLTARHLPAEPPNVIVAVGKAAVPMARAASERFPDVPAWVTPPAYDPAVAGEETVPDTWTLLAGAHPVPDARSVAAADAALAAVRAVGEDGRVLALISGGGSALWCAPDGVPLESKRAVARSLMRAGASIHELNAVRKRLSRIKGGRLAAATRARVTALLLSDVPGDDPATIASGPTVPDPGTRAEALTVLDRFGVDAPEVRRRLERGASGGPEDAAPRPEGFGERVTTRVIGSNRTFLAAMRRALHAEGLRAAILSDRFEGEAREVARAHAAVVRSVRVHGTPLAPPVVLLSGGEATVDVRGDGVGGRNLEFALAFALDLGDATPWTLSAGTDGRDGGSDAAGAIVGPDTLGAARAAGVDAADHLARNDSGTFFERTGGTYVPGPTRHNLNDVRAIVIREPEERG